MTMDDDDMLECLLNFPDMEDNVPHLFDFQSLAIAQTQDSELQHIATDGPDALYAESF